MQKRNKGRFGEKQKFHTIEAHNFHIKRYGRCLYCESGSKPVHKTIIAEMT